MPCTSPPCETFEIAHHEHLAVRAREACDRLVHRMDKLPLFERSLRIKRVRRGALRIVDPVAERPLLTREGPQHSQTGIAINVLVMSANEYGERLIVFAP